MKFNFRLFFVMLTILISGSLISQEDENEFNKNRETEENNFVNVDEFFSDYSDKYTDLYSHKHEPHNKHFPHGKLWKFYKKRRYLIL